MSMTDDERRAFAAAMDRTRRIAAECVSELRRTSGLDLHAVVSKGANGPLVTIYERDANGRDVVREQWSDEEAWRVCQESKIGRTHEFKPLRPVEERGGKLPREVAEWFAEWKRTGVVPAPLVRVGEEVCDGEA